jgi:recombination DNA repair RAD52 pathway protein
MTGEEKSIQVVDSFDKVVQSVINEAQYSIIRGKTPKQYIKTRPGRGQKTFSYVPHGYVTSVLNAAFGFDWDWEIKPITDGKMYQLLPEDKDMSRPASIIVHGKLTVRVHDPETKEVLATIIKSSTGEREVIKGMTWGGMIKSAESDAFKKAASRLGVALDLYWEDPTGEMIPESEEEIALRKIIQEAMDSGLSDALSIDGYIKENSEIECTLGEIGKVIKNL